MFNELWAIKNLFLDFFDFWLCTNYGSIRPLASFRISLVFGFFQSLLLYVWVFDFFPNSGFVQTGYVRLLGLFQNFFGVCVVF